MVHWWVLGHSSQKKKSEATNRNYMAKLGPKDKITLRLTLVNGLFHMYIVITPSCKLLDTYFICLKIGLWATFFECPKLSQVL